MHFVLWIKLIYIYFLQLWFKFDCKCFLHHLATAQTLDQLFKTHFFLLGQKTWVTHIVKQ